MMPVYVVDEIQSVVAKVETAILSKLQVAEPTIQGIRFEYGHYQEIFATLDGLSKGPEASTKYPLVCLFQDFAELRGQTPGIYADVTLQLIIAKITSNAYNAPTRYEKNFKPILYPIYNEFIKQLGLHRNFFIQDQGLIPHTKIDRLYWGKNGLFGNTGNIFNDFIDCIEIENLKIKVKDLTNCK